MVKSSQVVVVVVVVGSFLQCLENFTDVNMYLNSTPPFKIVNNLRFTVTVADSELYFFYNAVHNTSLWRLIQIWTGSHPFGFHLNSDLPLYSPELEQLKG